MSDNPVISPCPHCSRLVLNSLEHLCLQTKKEPTIKVSELKKWIEDNQIGSDSKGGDYILVEDIQAKFCEVKE